MKTTLSNLLNWGAKELKKNNIPNHTREANLILEFVLEKNPLMLDSNTIINPIQQKKFQKLIQRRSAHEPFAYLTGNVKFCNHEIELNKHTLIPRPETELLVEIISKHVILSKAKDLVIADIGTGSGAIAISLTKKFPNNYYFAIDKYALTLRQVAKNIKKHDLQDKIQLLKGDLLSPLKNQKLDIIVANLPYVPEDKIEKIDKTVKEFEPYNALFSGPDGLNAIKKLLRQSVEILKPTGVIFLEIWPAQTLKIKKIAHLVFPKCKVIFHPDLAGIPRFAQIHLNPKS